MSLSLVGAEQRAFDGVMSMIGSAYLLTSDYGQGLINHLYYMDYGVTWKISLFL